MRYQPIENHGIVGNMHSAALVGLDGSVEWLCLPRFDSPSVFGAILDADKGGQMLGYGNHLGRYAEQTGPSGEALGNFPQAFTHLADQRHLQPRPGPLRPGRLTHAM